MLLANLMLVLILGLLIIIIIYLVYYIFSNQNKTKQNIKGIWYYILYFNFSIKSAITWLTDKQYFILLTV